MLTPMDIHNREFKKGFRGYSEDDVDAFMEELANDYEKVYLEYCEMKETMDKMKEKLSQYEKMESTMNSTLMLAQETAENVKNTARKEADLIIQEAESKRKQMIEEASMNLKNAQKEFQQVKNQISAFRAKVHSILTAQIHLMEDMELKDQQAPAIEFSDAPAEKAEEVKE